MKHIKAEKISITDIEGIRIGNAQSKEGMTGVTVIMLDRENSGGIDISGGGPAARESALLSPMTSDHMIHAIVLAGGSAYGLDAGGGVMRYLEEHDTGYHLLHYTIPLVCQSDIFDLGIGADGIRPDAKMGYQACVDAERNQPVSGNTGAGMGASVGKLNGVRRGMKSGIGYAAYQYGNLKVGAIAVVNAYGDVRDPKTGEIIAGALDENRTGFIDMAKEICEIEWKEVPEHANTTLGVIVTNADFSKADCSRLADMARAGLSRCIAPVGTPADGDTIYFMSLKPGVKADITRVGTIAADVLSEAILDAVRSAQMPDEEFLELIHL